MNQLTFCWPQRWEIPASRMTWRDGETVQVRDIGAHSVDLAWPWFAPGWPLR